MTYEEYLEFANQVEIALGHPITRDRHQQVLAREFRQAAEACLPEGWMSETDPDDDIDMRFQNAVKTHIAAAAAEAAAELNRVGALILERKE
jgi:hypothetical protein